MHVSHIKLLQSHTYVINIKRKRMWACRRRSTISIKKWDLQITFTASYKVHAHVTACTYMCHMWNALTLQVN